MKNGLDIQNVSDEGLYAQARSRVQPIDESLRPWGQSIEQAVPKSNHARMAILSLQGYSLHGDGAYSSLVGVSSGDDLHIRQSTILASRPVEDMQYEIKQAITDSKMFNPGNKARRNVAFSLVYHRGVCIAQFDGHAFKSPIQQIKSLDELRMATFGPGVFPYGGEPLIRQVMSLLSSDLEQLRRLESDFDTASKQLSEELAIHVRPNDLGQAFHALLSGHVHAGHLHDPLLSKLNQTSLLCVLNVAPPAVIQAVGDYLRQSHEMGILSPRVQPFLQPQIKDQSPQMEVETQISVRGPRY